jgi:hypothetical protein
MPWIYTGTWILAIYSLTSVFEKMILYTVLNSSLDPHWSNVDWVQGAKSMWVHADKDHTKTLCSLLAATLIRIRIFTLKRIRIPI